VFDECLVSQSVSQLVSQSKPPPPTRVHFYPTPVLHPSLPTISQHYPTPPPPPPPQKKQYDFSAAAVDLVTSVPIDPDTATSDASHRCRYGLERMTQLLKRRGGELPPEVHAARCVALILIGLIDLVW
jgi:hypothetical protein